MNAQHKAPAFAASNRVDANLHNKGTPESTDNAN